MKKQRLTYYLICKRLVGKRVCGIDYLFIDSEWNLDERSKINDYLYSYGSNDNSSYSMYNMDIINKIEEVDGDTATMAIDQQIRDFLKTQRTDILLTRYICHPCIYCSFVDILH